MHTVLVQHLRISHGAVLLFNLCTTHSYIIIIIIIIIIITVLACPPSLREMKFIFGFGFYKGLRGGGGHFSCITFFCMQIIYMYNIYITAGLRSSAVLQP